MHLQGEAVKTINVSIPSITSWKTTIIGLAAAILAVVQGVQVNNWRQMISDPTFQTKVLIAVLGFFAKDWNTTGGTVGQPSTPEALHAANQAPSTVNPPVPAFVPDPSTSAASKQ
jgi:hypothetical protein